MSPEPASASEIAAEHAPWTVQCWCCNGPYVARYLPEDPWEGRMDGYCYDCCLARCDAYPGECPNRPASPEPGGPR